MQSASLAAKSLIVSDARIDDHISDINQQVYQADHNGKQQDASLYAVVITNANGINHVGTKAGNIKNILYNGRAADDNGKSAANGSDNRDCCVPECMAGYHLSVGKSLGARCTDVVLTDNFQHGRARHTGEGCNRAQAQRAAVEEVLARVSVPTEDA